MYGFSQEFFSTNLHKVSQVLTTTELAQVLKRLKMLQNKIFMTLESYNTNLLLHDVNYSGIIPIASLYELSIHDFMPKVLTL